MFDFSFSELMLIGVVALVVIGPERMPKVARTVGAWLGRLNRYASQVKQDIDREMKLDQLREVQNDMQKTAQRYEIMASERVQEIESGVQASADEVGKVAKEVEFSVQETGKLNWADAEEAKTSATELPAATTPAHEIPAVAATKPEQETSPKG